MKKQDIYRELEEKMLGYDDYASVPVDAIDDPMIPIESIPNLTAVQPYQEMAPYVGWKVYVREGVARRLGEAASFLVEENPDLRLVVHCGYRALEIQKRNFDAEREKLKGSYSEKELLSATHRLIAVPEVAGHPAGAAVDILIADKRGNPLQFGTNIREFVPDSYTFSPFIDGEAIRNRQLLRSVMLKAGFAPFDGEWWHFSYGDKEWARYYNQPAALYNQTDFRAKGLPDEWGCYR